MTLKTVRCPMCFGRGHLEVDDKEAAIRRVISETARDWSITEAQLTGRRRSRNLVEARTHAARQLREMGLGLKQVGHWLGNRDHATVINMLNGGKGRK